MPTRRWFWPVVGVALALVAFDVVEARYVFAPLLGLFIWRVGIASLGSLRRGAAYVPDGPPEPVDPRDERITYWCGGCGAELLLLVRGAAVPPRHCGERMTERHEVARQSLP
ncbi:MAG: hypothetical protein M3493_07290 [Actinomycetota bacterium]|nr:hypothetical protein [Euzebyaceae bacterium]MDQ3452489.1 hypothetical protein [Actinomycetota bacterium]